MPSFSREAQISWKLLFVEIGVFGKSHHRSLDLDGLAGGEIANQWHGVSIRHANAANAGVNADVERDGLLRFGGDLVQCEAQRRVDHGHDASCDGVFEIVLVERAEQEDGLANAGIAERHGFVELHDGKAEDFRLRLKELGNVGHAHAVAVIFDDREDGTRGGAAGNFLDIVAQVFAMNLHPRIERGILRSARFIALRGGGERRRSAEQDGESETCFQEGPPRGLHHEAIS